MGERGLIAQDEVRVRADTGAGFEDVTVRDLIDVLGMALRAAVWVAAVGPLASCAVVKINDDATDTVDHGGGEETGKQLANLACHKAGAVRAEIISTVQKTGAEHDEKSRYTTTFRCLY